MTPLPHIMKGLRPLAFVATAAPARAIAFYRDVIGLALVADDAFAAIFDAAGVTLRLQKVERLTPAPYTVFGWHADDIAPLVARLAAAGVSCERYPWMTQSPDGIWDAPDGDRVAWFKDPDGNLLSVSQE